MKHLSLILLSVFAAITLAAAAQAVPTGAPAPVIPSPIWMDGKLHRISDFKDKKVTVLFIWNLDQHMLPALQQMVQVARKCDSTKTAFLGVGGANLETLKKIPAITRLPFPVCADHNRATARLFCRSYDRPPLAVVISKDGKVYWRGSVRQVPVVVGQIHSGKFDLKERLRTEKFSDAVSNAIRGKKFEDALKLIREEWERFPNNMELLSMQLLLLERHLKRMPDAFKLIETAHKKQPENPGIFELELQLLRNAGKLDRQAEWCQRLIAAHGSSPQIMIKFADILTRMPIKDMRMDHIHSLLHTGWLKGKFANNNEKGRYALDFAKIMHGFGRTDLAYKLTVQAEKLLTGKAKAGAADAAEYYKKILFYSPKFTL